MRCSWMGLALLLPSLGLCAAIQWLSLAANGTQVAWDNPQDCRLLASDALARLCRRHLEAMPSLVEAARQTKAVCQQTFANSRWNCSSVEGTPHLAPDLQRGTRESAFVYALASSAASHSIARACASGQVPFCFCGSSPSEAPHPSFQWGGCGDNLPFGLQLGSAFVDGPMKFSKAGRQISRVLNLHNNAVGRQVSRVIPALQGVGLDAPRVPDFIIWYWRIQVRELWVQEVQFSPLGCLTVLLLSFRLLLSQVLSDSLETMCKCHGVSGSCTVKTCWKGLRDLATIGSELKSKYLEATQVMPWLVGSRRQLAPRGGRLRPLKADELAYLVHSPTYCLKNPKLGSLGTQDRPCNKTSAGSGGCRLLCCGRGYNTYAERVEEKCRCRYHWCCYVTCKKCQRVVEKHVCK
uniref:Protein Wnt n=1 Tax=Podarcis muralis TaxID=64176 RepID=A0A670KIL7_PODMU